MTETAFPVLSDYPAIPAAPVDDQVRIFQLHCVWQLTPDVQQRAQAIRDFVRANFPADEVTAGALLTVGSITYQEIQQLKTALTETAHKSVN